jgi:hypothetical protein
MKRSDLVIIAVGIVVFVGLIAAATIYILNNFVASNIGVTI